ncbi:hypothetical protein [Bacillus sp. lyk4-R2A-2]|uniref:hypothetical protein n=1 Tax=Bacillus sp. lyk4-R2A-2 TaxID=3040282 RepID=UPI002550A333|nr:hypothetical protein [Bacillus sp. lyk4-R2A-2]
MKERKNNEYFRRAIRYLNRSKEKRLAKRVNIVVNLKVVKETNSKNVKYQEDTYKLLKQFLVEVDLEYS